MTENKSIKQQQHEKRVEVSQKIKFIQQNLNSLTLDQLQVLEGDLQKTIQEIITNL